MNEITDYVIDKTFKVPCNENGRVRLNKDENGTAFFLQDMIPKNERTNYYNATQYMFTPTLLSRTYFSLENIDIIQRLYLVLNIMILMNRMLQKNRTHDYF